MRTDFIVFVGLMLFVMGAIWIVTGVITMEPADIGLGVLAWIAVAAMAHIARRNGGDPGGAE